MTTRASMRSIAIMAVGLWLITTGDAVLAQEQSPQAIYDCGWIAPADLAECPEGDDPISELARAVDAHPVSSHFGPDEATWRRMLAAVNRARTTLDPARLPQRERIVAQNIALRIARRVVSEASNDADLTQELLREASALVAWLALEPDQLRAADTDAEMVRWLGSEAMWIEERLRDDPPLFHEAIYLHTRAFRMIRIGDGHFIFSQLVAVDTSWRPHVTPVIGDIEMRNDADTPVRACIAEFDAVSARCGAPAGLRMLDRPPISHLGGYVNVDAEGRGNCLSCHGAGQVLGRVILDLAPTEVADHLARRRSSLLALLQEHLAPIRSAAGGSPP
jgi:hypothetical protein